MNYRALAGLALTLAALPMTVAAATLAYEGFDYPSSGPKPLMGLAYNSGGTGFAGEWLDAIMEAGGADHGLTYARNGVALVVSGNSAYCQLGASGWMFDEMKRLLDLAQIPEELKAPNGQLGKIGTTLWFAMLVRLTEHPAHQAAPPPNIGWWAGLKLGSNGWFGRNCNASNWGIESPRKDSTVPVAYGETVLLVQKIMYTEEGAVTSLWVNPTPALDPATAAPPEPPAIADFVAKKHTFNHIVVSFSCEGFFDEIRIATTYHGVAPGQAVSAAMPDASSAKVAEAPGKNFTPAP